MFENILAAIIILLFICVFSVWLYYIYKEEKRKNMLKEKFLYDVYSKFESIFNALWLIKDEFSALNAFIKKDFDEDFLEFVNESINDD